MPDYEIRLWDGKSFDFSSNEYVKEAYGQKKWAFVTDYVRLHALYHYGGIYLDTDVEVFKSLDKFLRHSFFAAMEPSNYREGFLAQIEPAIMGSVKGHPFVEECLAQYSSRRFVNSDGTNNYYGVPLIMTDVATLYGFKGEDKEVYLDQADAYLYPTSMFSFPKFGSQSFAKHHYNGAWIDRGLLHDFCKKHELMQCYRVLESVRKFLQGHWGGK